MNGIIKCVAIIGGGVAVGVTLAALTAKAEPTEHTFELYEGKQYISLPVIPEDATPDAVLGIGVEVAGYYPTKGWFPPTILECGRGYLVVTAAAKTVTVRGTKCTLTLDTLIEIYNALSGIPYEGSVWALVGPGTKNINVSGSVLDGLIQTYIRETGEWEYTNILEPMKGYWMEKPIG